MEKNNKKIKSLIVLSIIVISIFAGVFLINNLGNNLIYSYEVKNFQSYDELLGFLERNNENNDDYFQLYEDTSQPSVNKNDDVRLNSNDEGSIDFSKTNVQVEGVDEPDIVKTDGTYLYVLAKQTIYILKVYPSEKAVLLSNISFEYDIYITNFFITDNYLVIFGSSYNHPILYMGYTPETNIRSDNNTKEDTSWEVSTSIVKIYDISEKYKPSVVKEIEIDGTYFDSRMIGNYIYIISSEYSYYIYREFNGKYTLNVPEITIDNITSKISYEQIYYIDSPEMVDTLTHIISINVENLEVNQKSFLVGISENMYMSENNIYLVYTKYDYVTNPLIRVMSTDYYEKTIIHKIQVDSGEINYIAKSEVPGHILNQFSMDEHNNFFRIATTIGSSWDQVTKSKNNIYVLNDQLEQISSIEGIAEGEQIYSSRFLGDKAYLVTFKNTDPFFTVDLSDPYNPRILGYLKIPGYSNYLHPYDDNHIIGIGKDTIESNNPDFAWYQGIKIAIFDVSDFENPVELDKIIIGDRGTDSPALYDHKSFLFDKDKELLVIPVSLFEINDDIKNKYNQYPGSQYGEFTFQGAYVLKLNLEGIDYRGRITHVSDIEKVENQYWYYWNQASSYISRSLFIGDNLYTISEKMVKINALDDLNEIKSIVLA